eukprot:446967_1
MCAARLCDLGVVYVEHVEDECYFESNESSFVNLFLTNYTMNIHKLSLCKENKDNQDLIKQILSMNAVLFIIKNKDELSKFDELMSNPVIRYNQLLSLSLCYVGSVIPKWFQTFGDLFEIAVYRYDKDVEMKIIRTVLKECDMIFKIQRETCLKKIESNVLGDIKMGFNVKAADFIISCFLALIAMLVAIVINKFANVF